mmetsp:Transcript_35916/g.110648  ORF Transcript_35916/g.110648 Transcript_35916/m.110648 type:complete len:477 (-) Transcript_35916:142-1572(-)|eukprot:CAMPEP_0174833326 /NCGR_PEP_ID=MMETSP1114-20130205/4171_1 /TAXON_ID=312471 /ORGANISM="Neobodo designis, Strain CCAP 1951/1" /LENGTH=476 /DNA_ID=CAMNT_0016067205 /DNA_START=50 /DNA_END=1480 /DNA_ORIENTATION=-
MSVVQWGPRVVEVTRSPAPATPGSAASPTSSFRSAAGGNVTPRSGGVVVTCRNASEERAAAQRSGAEQPASALAMLAAPTSRAQLLVQQQASAGAFSNALAAAGIGGGEDSVYWRPTEAAGEMGLIEAFAHKADTARHGAVAATNDGLDHFVLVYSRPEAELQRNFSNARGERVDLSLPHFQLSRSSLALRELDALHDDAAIRGRDVKQGLRAHLPGMQEDHFFLVSYRDYSDFAVRACPNDARRARFGSPKFVEKHFAVRVGQSAGVFIPVTPAQFARGWEMLRLKELNRTGHGGNDPAQSPLAAALSPWALNADQFRSLGAVPRDVRDAAQFDRQPAAAAGAAGAAAVGGHAVLAPALWYKPGQQLAPHAWDLSPAAMQWRLQRALESQYMAVGRLVVKGAIVCGAIFVARYAFSQGSSGSNTGRRGRRGATTSTWGGGDRRGGYDDRTTAEAFFDAATSLNPFAFAQYLAGSS